MLQIVGDHKKCVDGTDTFELGVIFYIRSSRNKNMYKKGDDWWLIDQCDIIKPLQNPTTEKVSGKRVLFTFKDLMD